jgi:hypothetical protein
MPTLEELENDVWGEPKFDSYLVLTCHALRKKDLDQFTTEDLRILVGQTISMPILLPRAVAVLERDPMAEGDFFPGDLLSALIRRANWPSLAGVATPIKRVCERALKLLEQLDEWGCLPDGRSVGEKLAAKLRGEIGAYLDA